MIIVNGYIHEGDTIVLAGQEGPIATQVRGLLQPAPMSELRVKGTYQHLKQIKGAQGVKLIAKDLEKALAGLPLYVATDLAEEVYYKVSLGTYLFLFLCRFYWFSKTCIISSNHTLLDVTNLSTNTSNSKELGGSMELHQIVYEICGK